MAMAARIATRMEQQRMNTSAVLTMTQWLSPSYPLGSFAYSHGLETAIAEAWVTDASDLRVWLEGVMASGSGWADAVLFCAAFRAMDVDTLMQVDASGRAFSASQERLRESLNQGAAFARTVGATSDEHIPETLFPIAVGWASARHDAPLKLAMTLYLQAFVSNIVMACVRLIPLGQTDGQTIIKDLAPLCELTADAAIGATLDDLYSNTFLSDIAAMRHEVQQPRLFQS